MPVFAHLHGREMFPHVQSEHPLRQLCAIPFCYITDYQEDQCENHGCVVQTFKKLCEIDPLNHMAEEAFLVPYEYQSVAPGKPVVLFYN